MRALSPLLPLLALAAPAMAADYPLTLDNCGVSLTVAAPPQRVVTVKSTATEMLLALGLGDRIVGVGFQDGPVPDAWAADAARLTVLAERVPSAEVVLETEPDFVYAGWESSFSGDGVGERDMLAGLGIAGYVAPAACRTPPHKPARLGFEDLFADIAEIGRIFDVEDRATALVASQRELLAAVSPAAPGQTALWWSSGTGTPYVGGGTGGPQMMLDALGLENIFAGIDDTWSSASWEAVVEADPDVIVLVDAAWNTAAQKRRYLADNPATANLAAVAAERYLVIPFPAAEPGVRSVPAVADLARQLEALPSAR